MGRPQQVNLGSMRLHAFSARPPAHTLPLQHSPSQEQTLQASASLREQ
jgi:hypothetical protein